MMGYKYIFLKLNILVTMLSFFFNIDGLPIHKNSKKQFWPILCRIGNTPEPPFIVAIYLGESKPPLDQYLKDFVDELGKYLQNGFATQNDTVSVTVGAFCCDTPARSFIKNVKGHNAYNGCDFCPVKGEYIEGRMTFCDLNAPLRSDTTFSSKANADHHKRESALEKVSGMVSKFPLDYMHSVCLGVMRKLLFLWRDQGRGYGITGANIQKINDTISKLKPYWPVEFNRKPNLLTQLEYWKATEYRQFLLYVGPLVLKGNVPNSIYGNFMILSYAISILLNADLNKRYNDYAGKLLKLFVKHSVQLYGKTFCTYNTHSLVHLSEQAARFGSLENISCFVFENFLGHLKTLLRKPSLPLSQVVRRYKEIGISNRCCPKKILDNEVSLTTAMAVFNVTKFGVQTYSFFSLEYEHIALEHIALEYELDCNSSDSENLPNAPTDPRKEINDPKSTHAPIDPNNNPKLTQLNKRQLYNTDFKILHQTIENLTSESRYKKFSEVSDNDNSSSGHSNILQQALSQPPIIVDTLTTSIDSLENTRMCAGCKISEELFAQILEKLEALSDDIKYLMLCNQNGNKDPEESITNFKSCETVEDLNKLENSLSQETVFLSTCTMFQVVGGKDVVETARRVLTKLLKNELATSMNWTGRNNKHNFSTYFNVRILILVAVRRNPFSRNAMEKEVESIIKLYLRNICPQRVNTNI